jgi:glucose/arabinose dehydrogenase
VKGNLSSIALRAGFACVAFVLAQAAFAQRLPLERIKLPPGFEIGVFADRVPDARSLALGKDNVLFVGTRADRVYAVRYRDAKATQVVTIASGLRMPNGVALKDGALYVAEVNRILRFDDI